MSQLEALLDGEPVVTELKLPLSNGEWKILTSLVTLENENTEPGVTIDVVQYLKRLIREHGQANAEDVAEVLNRV